MKNDKCIECLQLCTGVPFAQTSTRLSALWCFETFIRYLMIICVYYTIMLHTYTDGYTYIHLRETSFFLSMLVQVGLSHTLSVLKITNDDNCVLFQASPKP